MDFAFSHLEIALSVTPSFSASLRLREILLFTTGRNEFSYFLLIHPGDLLSAVSIAQNSTNYHKPWVEPAQPVIEWRIGTSSIEFF